MAGNTSPLRICCMLLLFLCFADMLPGQNSNVTDTDSRFVQRFSWQSVEYALQYEVIFEREINGIFHSAFSEFTEDSFIEVSLPPGRYRLRIIPYDVRNIPAEGTEWRIFDILPAWQPRFTNFSPAVVYLEEHAQHSLDVFGENFTQGSELYLQGPEQEIINPAQTIIQNSNHARLVFNYAQLTPGIYEIHIRNPGGLESVISGLRIAIPDPDSQEIEQARIVLDTENEQIKKGLPFDIFASIAWAPFIPYYEGEGGSFKNTPSTTGAAIRVGIITDKDFFDIYPGFDLAFSRYSVGEEQTINATLNLLAQKRINDAAAINFRLGIGFTYLSNLEIEALSFQHNHTNLGLSFVWQAFAPLFFEAGIEYTNYFTNYASGCFRPWIGFGFRL